jgi:NAD(P)-dependent dehydrogenase (short-subunit alcohol dehydrogenase family)
VVVGAGRGIGRMLADAFAARGARLVLASRSEAELRAAAAELEANHGVPVEWEVTDVADHASVLQLAASASARDAVAGVVNCAAILGPVGRIDDVDMVAWRAAVTVDLMGTASCCAAFAPVLAMAGGGSIVNLSGGGVGGPALPERISAYVTAKAGVVALTEALGRELSPLGVRVNVVAPGPVPTGFMREVLKGGPAAAGTELYERTVAQHEHPEPTDALVELVAYLLSPASAHVTGRFLSARWDAVGDLESLAARSSRYTLRRIDGALYDELEKGEA